MSLTLLLLALIAPVNDQESAPVVERSVGIEGEWRFRYRGPELMVRPEGGDPRILVRIADQQINSNGEREIRLLFLARAPGDYDLRDHVWFAPGTPIEGGLPPLAVHIRSLLPPDHQGELESLRRRGDHPWGGFRAIFWTVFTLWAAPMLFWLAWRWWRRPRPAAVVTPPVLTLADQLRPLLEAALIRRLDDNGRARLERLLIAHWRQQLCPEATHAAEALQRIRAHPEAGQVLHTIEKWLHAPPERHPGQAEVDRVLQAFRDQPALQITDSPEAPS